MLREAEQRLKLVFDNSTDMMAIIEVEEGPSFQILSVNQTYLKVIRASGYEVREADLIGRKIQEVIKDVFHFPANELPEIMSRYLEVIASRQPKRYEEVIDTPRGIYYGESVLTPALDELGNCTLILYSSRDITERKLAEIKIKRLNRLYAVSNGIDEAILRIREPRKLYEQACRIAVEEGLLRMAWVGLLDAPSGRLKPVARWGWDEGYTDFISIPVNDLPQGLGPGGRAFRTGAFAYSNNIATDPTFITKVEALARGYRSCAAFPIKVAGQPIGVMVIYADQTEYFNDEELRLLNSLAENFSFAIESAQKEEQRQRAELARHESEQRFRQLAEAIQEVFWMSNPDSSQILYVSPAYETIWGRSCKALYRSPLEWLNAIHFQDQKRVWDALRHKLLTGQYDEQYRIVRPDGTVRWISDRAFPIRNEKGEVYRIAGVAQDITEQELAKQARLKSEAEFRVTFENAAISVALVDMLGHSIKSNPALQAFLGYSAAELRELTFERFTHPQDLAADLSLYRELMDGKREHYQIEKRYLTKNGRTVWGRLTASLVRDAEGKPQYAVAMVEDITLRQLAQAALKEEEAKFRSIFENAVEGIFRSTPAGKYIALNPAYAQIHGYSSPEEMMQNCTDIAQQVYVDSAQREELKRRLQEQGQVSAWELQTCRRDGSKVWVSLNARLCRDTQGGEIFYEGTIIDITERKRAETLAESQRKTLEMIAAGADLTEILETIVRLVESQLFGGFCSVLLLEGETLRHGAAPSLPASYLKAIDGIRIGPQVGSCGSAAALGVTVSVPDVTCDARWAEYAPLVLAHGLRACWSTPIFSEAKKVLGTFAIYYAQARHPEPAEMVLVNAAKHLAAIAIERSQAEERLRRINRLYAVSSNINEAIVRLREPRELYQVACRIAVEDGLLQMAWIGLLDVNTQELRPVCSWGNDAGYTAQLKITVDDSPHGRGVAGVALRTGAYAASNDIEKDPNMAPWREAALTRGFRSVVAFPLKISERVIGVMGMFADRTDYFNADELNLLNALAQNLSFAVESAEKEAQRVENQRVLSTLLGNLPGMVYRCRNDRDWTIEFVSEGCRELLGYAPDELVHNRVLSFADTIHPDDQQPVWDQVQEAVAVGKAYELVYRVSTRSGTEKWVWERGQAVVSVNGAVLFLEGFVTDITQRRVAQEQVRHQAAWLDKARDAILVTDMEDRVSYWNQSAERLFGWAAADVIGLRAGELFVKQQSEYLNARKTVLATGEWAGEFKTQSPKGRDVIVESRWTLVLDDAGKPASVLVINTDITEKKKLEAQFLRAQRMESIGTLAGGIAHDLNNVLAPIIMSVDLLKSTPLTESEHQGVLDTIGNSAHRGAEMVRQVLSFVRGMEGERVTVQAKHIIREIQKIVKDTFPKSIQIQVWVAPEIWTLQGDPTQLHQVLLNLAVNARDAMPQGGTLRITAENNVFEGYSTPLNPAKICGSFVSIHVMDDGTGMTPEVKERIFEPFFTTKDIGKGTGLGLATTLAIVKSHGGFIEVNSESGEGSTFSIHLPADTRSSGERPVSRMPQPLRGKGELILVIDDELPIRSVTQHTLEAFGYRVVTAADGAEGVAIYAQQQSEIAVVITDMMMPVMDGAAVVRALLKMNSSVRVITTSGLTAGSGVAKEIASLVERFLAKPYTTEVLLRTLREIIDQTDERV